MVSDYRGSTYTITANSAILILFLIHDYKNHNVLFCVYMYSVQVCNSFEGSNGFVECFNTSVSA